MTEQQPWAMPPSNSPPPQPGAPYQGAPQQGTPYQGAPQQGPPYQGAPPPGAGYQPPYPPNQGAPYPPNQGAYPYPPNPGAPYQNPPYQAPGQMPPYAAANDDQRRILAAKGKRGIAIGMALFVVGLLITVFTYSAASGGGVYVVAWGPMVFGGIRLISGLITLSKSRR